VLFALGITWILDGLEVNLAGALSGALEASPSPHFSDRDVAVAASIYLAGAVCGAFFFGWLTDRLGRKRLLIGTGERSAIAGGYAFGAALMLGAALVECVIGVDAERRALGDIALPLSAVGTTANG